MSKKILKNKKNLAPREISMSFDQAYQLAMQNFQSGNLLQAEQLCRQLLDISPDNADCNYLAGLIAAQQGEKDDRAIECIRKTLSANPHFAEAHKNLGMVFHRMVRLDEAVVSYRKALSLESGYANVQNNLGNIFQEQGMTDEAVACYGHSMCFTRRVFFLNSRFLSYASTLRGFPHCGQ